MLGFVDVILRVPPIFIIDEILKISMGIPFAPHNSIDTHSSDIMVDDATNTTVNRSHQIINDTKASPTDLFDTPNLIDDIEFYQILSITSLKFFSCLLGEWPDNINHNNITPVYVALCVCLVFLFRFLTK